MDEIYQQSPPSREKVLDRSMSIVRVKHDTGDKEHQKLKDAIVKIIKFGYHVSDDDEIYQYEEKYQHLFWEPMTTILDGSASIEPMINKEKIEQYRAENLQVAPNPLIQQPVIQDTTKKQSGNAISRFFGDKKETNANEPYQMAIPTIFEHLKRIKRLDLFIEYQSYGVKHVKRHSKKWMNRYKRFHYNRFQFVVAPTIIRKHKQYLENGKDTEKMYSLMMGTANDRLMHQMRSDFQQQNNPQQ